MITKNCDICGTPRTLKHNYKKNVCWACSQKQRILPCGKNSGNYKHGISTQGYRRITLVSNTGKRLKRVNEHRYVMEQFLNRKLKSNECVHHIDFDKLNNDISNLYLCTNSYHRELITNIEQLGFTILNKYLWFSRERKEYILENVNNIMLDEPVIIFPEYTNNLSKKISIKNGRPKVQTKRHHFKGYHKLVMECFLGRELKSKENDEYVHHIDGDKFNNSINNLCLLTNKEHQKAHNSLVDCVINLYKNGLIIFQNGLYKLRT